MSRSGKKVLHVDRNDYYGGAEAALSLQEVASWVDVINNGMQAHCDQSLMLTVAGSRQTSFANCSLDIPDSISGKPKLGFSRAYNISLSPQFLYTRSNLIPALVSSKVHRQIEFLAVGSWWIYDESSARVEASEAITSSSSERSQARLSRIPGGREDVFRDRSIDLRSTRSLMKFLRIAANFESHALVLERYGQTPFPSFLRSEFNIPERLQPPLLALTSSMDLPGETLTSYALPRIHRHLSSIGIFGHGFGSVIPKWGGIAEVAQVSCRAGAVGGGVYVLKKGISAIRFENGSSPHPDYPLEVRLDGSEEIKTRWVVGTEQELPRGQLDWSRSHCIEISYRVTIVSSALSTLFPALAEGAPAPAGAVIVVQESHPVYLIVHSSDTGECPVGQCKFEIFFKNYPATCMMTPQKRILYLHCLNFH